MIETGKRGHHASDLEMQRFLKLSMPQSTETPHPPKIVGHNLQLKTLSYQGAKSLIASLLWDFKNLNLCFWFIFREKHKVQEVQTSNKSVKKKSVNLNVFVTLQKPE